MKKITVIMKAVRVMVICGLGFLPGFAFADSCDCQSPCSGSVSCSGGCYAFCEENPEGSGRHVCVKGCASETTSNSAIPDNEVDASTDEAAPTSE